MGALVGALFTGNVNKTNNKQRVSRGYDSESDHLFRKPSLWLGFCFSGNGNP